MSPAGTPSHGIQLQRPGTGQYSTLMAGHTEVPATATPSSAPAQPDGLLCTLPCAATAKGSHDTTGARAPNGLAVGGDE